MKKIRLAIVDDHRIVLDGLKALLQHNPEFEIVLESTTPETVIEALEHTPADILITDLQMPVLSGIELGRQIRATGSDIKILALSMSGDGYMINTMIEACDISGYLLKNTGKEELVTALQKVAAGGVYFSDELLQEMMRQSELHQDFKEAMLTQREIEIIKLIEKELSNKEIADTLFISQQTVETHRKNIYRKTKTNSLVGLLKYAYERRIV